MGVYSLAGAAAPGAGAESRPSIQANPPCDLTAAKPWIAQWLAAWDLTSGEILRLPPAPPPGLVFYDSSCVYTTSAVTAGASASAKAGEGPGLGGSGLTWRVGNHGDTLTLPNGRQVPVALMSFADNDRKTGPFFVMAAPDYWVQAGHGKQPGLTAVFLHEFTHTRQLPGVAHIIGPIDSTWKFPWELDDDAVQKRFGSDSVYVKAYLEERDLLYRAAAADSLSETRALAAQALEMIRDRHARWFTGEDSVFATLDGLWLSMEGAAQWAGHAWLAHPKGGGLDPDAAVKTMLGRRRWWAQDEGLAVFLVVNRLMPEWPSLVFRNPSASALELLEQATRP